MKDKNILVTGGMGFIGSSLVTLLRALGNDLIVVDDMLKGITLDSVLSDESFDIIYHLGMPSSVSMMYYPGLFCRVIEDFHNILAYADIYLPKLVIASTSSLYINSNLPNKETDTVYPFDYYTLSRYSIERLSADYNAICLRLFSVYGEDQKKGKYANVITQMRLNDNNYSFEVYGNGTQTRDFINVQDVARAFVMVGDSDKRGVYNVGTGIETQFNSIADMTECNITYVDNPIEHYVYRSLADTKAIQRDIGFKAEIGIEDGIKRLMVEQGK